MLTINRQALTQPERTLAMLYTKQQVRSIEDAQSYLGTALSMNESATDDLICEMRDEWLNQAIKKLLKVQKTHQAIKKLQES